LISRVLGRGAARRGVRLPPGWILLIFSLGSISAQDKCLPCHKAEIAAFAPSGMGRSIAAPMPRLPSFHEQTSDLTLSVEERSGKTYHRVERAGIVAEHPVAIAIGSGAVGHSYGVRIGQSLFQSPISWFSQAHRWDASPGYDRKTGLDFDRRITMECLFCHSGGMRQVTDAPHAITCERCHAASDKHFANPAKLDPSARDRICEQCHLQGEARILNPGASWSDSDPAFTTYVSSNAQGDQKVVSQVEQLALSKCAQKSGGKLWCGTCHNPHGVARDQRSVCLTCHAGSLPASHLAKVEDCAKCHMPRTPSAEVVHTVYTDHRIRKNGAVPVQAASPIKLVAWRDPAPEYRRRNVALAEIYVGERKESVDLVQEGFKILVALEAKDEEVLTAIGSVLLQKQRPAEAADIFAKAVRLQPKDAGYAHNLGVALLSKGDVQAAIRELERAINLDPLDEQAYVILVQIYATSGKADLRRKTIARYLDANPQSLRFRAMNR
jgi:tetratricopeptide (TPR) repeat protein